MKQRNWCLWIFRSITCLICKWNTLKTKKKNRNTYDDLVKVHLWKHNLSEWCYREKYIQLPKKLTLNIILQNCSLSFFCNSLLCPMEMFCFKTIKEKNWKINFVFKETVLNFPLPHPTKKSTQVATQGLRNKMASVKKKKKEIPKKIKFFTSWSSDVEICVKCQVRLGNAE